MKRFLAAFILCLLLPGASCAPGDRAMRAEFEASPVRSLSFWGSGWQETPLAKRLAPAPPELARYIKLDNELHGYQGVPVPAKPAPEFAVALRDLEENLPKPVLRELRKSLIGVFTVTGLGSTGYTESVRDASGRERWSFMVLDREVLLSRTANAWASWRDSSFFVPDPAAPATVSATIEETNADTRANAARFIILHEFGHVLSLAAGALPSWWSGQWNPADHAFSGISWRMRDNDIVPRKADDFPGREKVRFYAFGKAEQTSARVPALYRSLSQTTFPSMYAATSPYEDFAETFALFQHTVVENRPYRVRVDSPGGQPVYLGNCLTSDRCPERRAFMSRFFTAP